mmetsp:Transcript_16342/g.24003  ORF Transcript_16342/g.24003 Transcript_16342/m.24003 type:complete len:85 (+) Transcript_16342:89-343(+)
MGACCTKCPCYRDTVDDQYENMTPEERERRRKERAEAAAKRKTDFKQGGGGEKAKRKAQRVEEAERIAAQRGPNDRNPLQWNVG